MPFLKAGEKRPNRIDTSLWISRSPKKDYDKEIDISLEQGRTFLRAGEKRPAILNLTQHNKSLEQID
jgi:hypothetical protein